VFWERQKVMVSPIFSKVKNLLGDGFAGSFLKIILINMI